MESVKAWREHDDGYNVGDDDSEKDSEVRLMMMLMTMMTTWLIAEHRQ